MINSDPYHFAQTHRIGPRLGESPKDVSDNNSDEKKTHDGKDGQG
jgi:hypothetical protein